MPCTLRCVSVGYHLCSALPPDFASIGLSVGTYILKLPNMLGTPLKKGGRLPAPPVG